MLLAIDIGNTNVVLALLDAEDRVLEERRAPSKDGWTAEQYAAQIRALLCGRAAERGLELSGLQVSRPTLEDVYLELTA